METDSKSAKRGPGRPKGLPRTGGRQKGTPNRLPAAQREVIASKYRPAEFLGRIVLGQRQRVGPPAGPGQPQYAYPTLAQRLQAAEILLAKTLPDLKANELTGPGGAALIPERPALDVDVSSAE